MADEKFFLHPESDWQRRYEALRASFVDRMPAKVVADRFGYSPSYINLLRHQFSGLVLTSATLGWGQAFVIDIIVCFMVGLCFSVR